MVRLAGRTSWDQHAGNVITGMLAGFAPARSPAAASEPAGRLEQRQQRRTVVLGRSYCGHAGGAGTITSEAFSYTRCVTILHGPLRSPSRLQNTFAHECMLDEVAAHVRADPVAYRLRHLSDARPRRLSRSAKAARWEASPSPRPRTSRRAAFPAAASRAWVYEGDNGYVAMVADVEVTRPPGKVTPGASSSRRIAALFESRGMRKQLEGGALQGLSRALGEEVTWTIEKSRQSTGGRITAFPSAMTCRPSKAC